MTVNAHALAGAYVCDALDQAESAVFEAHLAQCETCAFEVAEFRATVAALAVTEIEPPAAALRERVLNQIVRTGQVTTPSGPAIGRFGLRPVKRQFAAGTRPPVRTRHRPGTVAALLAGLVLLGSYAGVQQHRITELSGGRPTTIGQIMAAPDAQVSIGAVQPGGTATVVSSRSDNEAVFSASGLAALQPGDAYQLWFVDQADMRPGPVLSPVDGSVPGVAAAQLDGAQYVAMTVEPTGGSAQPTSAQLLLLPLR